MVQQNINSIDEIDSVMSKLEALQQCEKYLDTFIAPENRIECNSTGEAAVKVSRMHKSARIAAIAPRIAADSCGLKIISDEIQDDPNNYTEFLLLKNKA